jgi:hypothetical protein
MFDISVAERDSAVDGPLQDCVPRMHLLLCQPCSEFSVFGRIRANWFYSSSYASEVPGLNLGWAANYSNRE